MPATDETPVPPLLASATDTRWGWMAGVGGARAFDVEQDITLVKAGINYRFGPTAVVARY